MTSQRPSVTIVTSGNEPRHGFLYHGRVVVLERRKSEGRILLENGNIAYFQTSRVCSCSDYGRKLPYLNQFDPAVGANLEVGASVVALLSVNSLNELIFLKLTTFVEFARVRHLIKERVAREEFQKQVQPLVLKFSRLEAPTPTRHKGPRPCDLKMTQRYQREA